MTLETTVAVRGAPELQRKAQPWVVAAGGVLLMLVTSLAAVSSSWRVAVTALIGSAAGFALYHAAFGFASAWRVLLIERDSVRVRVQLIMFALTMAVFFPLLAKGSAFGVPLYGFVNSVGLALCLGAFLFGIGMQLGGGCGSGTLYTVGGGSTRMLATLAAFIAGSLIATADPFGWRSWPDIGAHSIIERYGAPAGLAVALTLLAGLYAVVCRIERARHGHLTPLPVEAAGSLLRGPWSLMTGAVVLAVVNVATLLVAGRPWGITSAFALWGAKSANAVGVDVASWDYWRGDPAIAASVFADVTSVMDFGIMIGALMAAGLAGRFAPGVRVSTRSLAAAVLGGVLMGIGARMATGCNIGALFSGLASGSLHGLVWLVFALAGSAAGVRLRPLFKLGS